MKTQLTVNGAEHGLEVDPTLPDALRLDVGLTGARGVARHYLPVQVNPLQASGIGEFGIRGAAAAVTDTIYNACGVRLRGYPATPGRIIGGFR